MYSWYITGVCLLHNDVIRQKHIDRCVFFIIPLGFGLTMVKKKKQDVLREAATGFVSARYRNCTVNNPVSVYTADKIRKHKIYIQYQWLQDYCAVPNQSLGCTVLSGVTNCRHSSLLFINVALLLLDPPALLVAALIIFHANLVCAQHLHGVWRSALMAAGFCSHTASCLCSALFPTQASQWWEEHQNYKGSLVWLCPPARTLQTRKTCKRHMQQKPIQVCSWRRESIY